MRIRDDINRLNRRQLFGTLAAVPAVSSTLMAGDSEAQALSAPASKRNAKQPFRGVFTIPSTPFQANGEIDIPSFRRMIDFCVACDAHGLVFPVNASEWTALSDDERVQLDKVLVEQNAGRLPVVIGVQASTAENAAKFAAHARSIGADAVMAMPPHGETSQTVLFDYYRRISEIAHLPVFVQDHDPPAGTPMPVDFLGNSAANSNTSSTSRKKRGPLPSRSRPSSRAPTDPAKAFSAAWADVT